MMSIDLYMILYINLKMEYIIIKTSFMLIFNTLPILLAFPEDPKCGECFILDSGLLMSRR